MKRHRGRQPQATPEHYFQNALATKQKQHEDSGQSEPSEQNKQTSGSDENANFSLY